MKKIAAIALCLLLACSLFACKTESNDPATELVVVKVGASPTPHAELLNLVVEDMAALGYKLEVIEFTDYVQPNIAVSDGSLDANFFQHLPYLDSYNAENGTTLVAVAPIHYEPYGVYAGKDKSVTLETLADGATVAVPNDPSNEARALLLLESLGLIKLEEGAGLEATILDIVENPKNLEFVEIEPAQLVISLPDVDIAVINGNYAIAGGLSVADDAIAVEDKDSSAAQQYANYLVVNAGHETDPGILALIQCMQSDKVRSYIETTYSNGAVIAQF